jgi:hypothetical protein
MKPFNYFITIAGIILLAAPESIMLPVVGLIMFTLGVLPAIRSNV